MMNCGALNLLQFLDRLLVDLHGCEFSRGQEQAERTQVQADIRAQLQHGLYVARAVQDLGEKGEVAGDPLGTAIAGRVFIAKFARPK